MYRFDLASFNEPRVILITDENGKRSTLPRLGYVVMRTLPQARDYVANKIANMRLIAGMSGLPA